MEREGRLRAALSRSVWKAGARYILFLMRRLFLVVALFAVLMALPTAAGTRARPSVTVTRVIPLTVRGANFVAGERVSVTIRMFDTYRKKTVTAGRRGGFLATYRFGASKCVTIHVVARGSKGSRATTTVPATCAP